MFVTDLWCRLSHSIPIVIILVSAFSIMMISIDRWMCVVYSRQRQLNSRDIIIIIASIWILSLSLAAPTFFHRQKQENLMIDSMKDEFYRAFSYLNFNDLLLTNVEIENETVISMNVSNNLNFENLRNIYAKNENVNLCVENWPYPYQKRIYVFTLFGLEFFLPCLTMLITYVWIIRFLKKHDQRMLNHVQINGRKSKASKSSRSSRETKSTKSCQRNCLYFTSLCLAFIICSLPLSLLNILLDIYFDLQQKENIIYWSIIVLTTLELMNIVVSPILYGYMNQNFKNELKKLNDSISSKFCRKSNKNEKNLEITLLQKNEIV